MEVMSVNRLKQLRLENGYKSQQDLAAVLFVNQTAVSQWERGVTIPNNQMLIKLSKMYGVSIDYLLGTSNERLPQDGRQRKELPAESEELSDTRKEALQFINKLSDDQLARFINMGRAALEMGGGQQTQNTPRRESGG